MPRLDYKRCRNCGRFSKDVGDMSHSRLCPICGPAILTENIEQLVAHDGPRFLDWRLGMIRCAGGIVPERLLTTR